MNTLYPIYAQQKIVNILWPSIHSKMEVAEAQELFDLNPDIDIHETDIFGFSWLSSALAQGKMELVKFLLEKTNAVSLRT